MKIFKLKGIPKKYAFRAAQYRRVAKSQGIVNLDFSESALRELFAWESRGEGNVDKSKNGFAYGKWCVDLSVSMWIEGIESGDFCKAEFLRTRLQKLHNQSKLEKIVVAQPFFPYAKKNRDSRKQRARRALEALCAGDDAPYWIGDDGCITVC